MKKIIQCLLFFVLFAASAMAQNRTITGTVKGKEDGLPIPGVSVKLKGTSTGVATGTDGRYAIRISSANAILEFSSVGYAPQSVAVASKDVIDISLGTDAKTLGEVVVTALGVSRAKKTLGYSSTQVSAEEINRASPTNLASGLQGKVAGVDISTTSGQPGGSSKVILRGFSSISGNNQPLYVIDGVPVNNTRPGGAAVVNSIGDLTDNYDFGNAANDINPNEIESVSILKGAAASSLYGSRASNGVIIITTKKGKAGAFKVDFSSSAALTKVSIVPDLQDQYGQGFSRANNIAENGSWGAKLDGQMRPWGSEVDGVRQYRPFSAVKNNFKDAFDTGKEFNNNLSFSGGNEVSTFRFSYGNVYSNGILPGANDTYKRNTIGLSGSTKYKAISLNASVNYVGKNTRAPRTGTPKSGVGTTFYEDILQIPVDFPIRAFEDYKNKYYNVDGYFSAYSQNPYYSIYENGATFKSDRVYGNIDAKFKASDWLSFQFQQGYDINNIVDKIWDAKSAATPGSWAGGGNDEGAVRKPNVGDVVEGSEKYFEFDSKLNALFNKKISTDIDVNGLVGFNFNDRGSRVLYTGVEDLAIPGFYHIENSPNNPTSTQSSTQRRLFGLYASATIGFKNYAFLTLNARNDWSSTLPVQQRSYFYPGANFSLLLSEVYDLKSANISLFKIRAAYGKTGSDTNPYSIYNTLTKANINMGYAQINFPIDGVSGYTISNTLNNSNLRPEISTETEFGAELKFFNNRLGLDISYYNRVTNDQILPVASAPSIGYNFRVVNFGKVRNRGVEIALSGTPIKTKDISWDIMYTFTRNRNVVLALPDGLNKVVLKSAFDAQLVARVGQPLGVIEAPVAKYDPQGRIVVSANGFPLQANDLGAYGNSQRDFIMGLNNNFRYKEFSLGFAIDYKKGGVFYSGSADLLNFVGNSANTLFNDRRTFIVPNSVVEVKNNAGQVIGYAENTKAITESNVFAYYYTDLARAIAYKSRIIDKTFIKLREVTLSYTLPGKIAKKIGAERASVTLYGRNLFTWLPKENRIIDPEVSNLGNDLASEFGEFRSGPSTKNYGLSLNVTF
ncbi:SusC/RagA family TonB-linked outer membrane protein [Pedobacter nutrimenti]|uniref:TonB-linked SusC/RagA family outer membrane protein n=1 Tax=Pedobacter nutrimenti TaxID=1241337 RepID=A0A318UHH6_9SPHI|nr:SusC/RagA family TonB-linked outer membrane protein [Pedobacter nutrimenti]PYF75864.1 TonB-linked SusC/RagA family outer membrane protein [Pedobacter nutrimenti]